MGDSESAAEGSLLGTWKFQEYKKKKDPIPNISLFENMEKFVKYKNYSKMYKVQKNCTFFNTYDICI